MTTNTRPAPSAAAKTLTLNFSHILRRLGAPARCPVAREAAREVLG